MHPCHPELAHLLTVWFEHRLDDMMPPRRRLARRYGLEVIDPDGVAALDPGAVRVVFQCESTDVASVRGVSTAGDGFDATAVVEWGWVPTPDAAVRPTAYPRRRWARQVTVTAQ